LGNKKDIQQVEAVAKEFRMTEEERREFGDFLEYEKVTGNGGTKNERVPTVEQMFTRRLS